MKPPSRPPERRSSEPRAFRTPTPPSHSFTDPRRLISLCLQVIRKAGRDCPADTALRELLRAQAALLPQDSQEITAAVFAYYRWLGWVRDEASPEAALRLAQECDRRFTKAPSRFTEEELASRAVPAWIADKMTITKEWLQSLQSPPRLWLRARKRNLERVRDELEDCAPASIRDCEQALEYRGVKDLFKTPAFHAGAFEVQDIASQVVGHLCDPKPGETWWDACAGEGGKLLHLSDLMENKGMIWASDRAAWRLLKLKRRAARAGVFNYRSAPWTGSAKLPTKTAFDGVLVDAPCSGVGTWQRNPHARWTTTIEDVQELAVAQLTLLKHASRGVKPGGKLFYSVCTLTYAETQDVARAFQEACPEFEPAPLPSMARVERGQENEAWIYPQSANCNGMFIAAWRRIPTAPASSKK